MQHVTSRGKKERLSYPGAELTLGSAPPELAPTIMLTVSMFLLFTPNQLGARAGGRMDSSSLPSILLGGTEVERKERGQEAKSSGGGYNTSGCKRQWSAMRRSHLHISPHLENKQLRLAWTCYSLGASRASPVPALQHTQTFKIPQAKDKAHKKCPLGATKCKRNGP